MYLAGMELTLQTKVALNSYRSLLLGLKGHMSSVCLTNRYASQTNLKIHYLAEEALELLILLFK